VQKTNPVTYLLEDSCGKPAAGGFYEYELHRVANPDVYLVEKVLRKKKSQHSCKVILRCKLRAVKNKRTSCR